MLNRVPGRIAKQPLVQDPLFSRPPGRPGRGGLVNNSRLSPMPSLTLKGNNTGGSAYPIDLTVSEINAMLGVSGGAYGRYFAASYGFATGNTAAQNTTAINDCIAAANAAGGLIILPFGTFQTNAWNTITANGCTVVGQGFGDGGTTLLFNNTTGDCITFSGNSALGIRDVWISSGPVIPISGFAIRFMGAGFAPTAERIRIDYRFNGIWVNHCSSARLSGTILRYMIGDRGIEVKGSGPSQQVYGCNIEGVDADNPYPRAYGALRTWAISTAYALNDILAVNGAIWQCDQAGTSAASGSGPSGVPGTTAVNAFTTQVTDNTVRWRFVCNSNLIWLTLDNYAQSLACGPCGLINGARGILMNDSANTGSSRPHWFNCWNVQTDHTFYDCVLLNGGDGFYDLQGWHGSSLSAHGYNIAGTFKGECIIDGNRIVANRQNGILLGAGVNTQIINNQIGANSQQGSGLFHGINVGANVSKFTIIGNTSGVLPSLGGNPQAYGIFVATGTSNRYAIQNNIVDGNVTGGVIDGGSGAQKLVANNFV